MHNTLAQTYQRAEPCRAEHVKVRGERRGKHIAIVITELSLSLAFDIYYLTSPDSLALINSYTLYAPQIQKSTQGTTMGHVSNQSSCNTLPI